MTNRFWGPLSTLKCLCRNFANAAEVPGSKLPPFNLIVDEGLSKPPKGSDSFSFPTSQV